MIRPGTLAAIALVAGCQQPAPAPENVESQLQTAPASLVTEDLGAPAGVTLQPGLAAVSWGPGRLDLFARSQAGGIFHVWFDGSWHPWEPIAGDPDTGLAASSSGAGKLDLFYRDRPTGRLRRAWFDNGWNTTGELVGASRIAQNTPTAASWSASRIDVFQRGSSSELRHIWNDNGWIGDWVTEANTSGTVASAPSAVAWGPGRLDLFWKEQASGQLTHWWFDGGLHPLDPRGGETLASAPTASSRGDGLLDVFFMSATNGNTLAHTFFNRWWASEDFTLSSAGSPVSVSWGPARVDIFYQDGSNKVRHTILPSAPVLTHRNDNGRTGANTREQELNTANVVSPRFGRLFEIAVDGNVYAQPLYVPTLDLRAQGLGIRNVVYVATANNTVYMADADSGQILRTAQFDNPLPIPYSDFMPGHQWAGICVFNMLPQIGITSTPVIDLASKTIYVANLRADMKLTAPRNSATCPGEATAPTTYRIQLHALDITTLAERTNSPVSLTKGPISTHSGSFEFDPKRQHQRPGLLLAGSTVYVGFGAHMDFQPYHGWVIGFDKTTLARKFAHLTTPSGPARAGGIWQSGHGLTADGSGNVYFLTGNGSSDPARNDYGLAAVKLSPDLKVLSHFIPWNQGFLNGTDADLGSGGVTLVPNTNFLLGGGKEGNLYLMDRNNLGGHDGVADRVVYQDQVTFADPGCADYGGYSNIHGAPAIWSRPAGTRFYLWGEEDFVRAWEMSGSKFTPVGRSAARAPCGMPGGVLTVSANGSVGGTGIVWGTVPRILDALTMVVPGRVYAFDAETMAQLWSTDLADGNRERHAKNGSPMVANGRLYVPVFGPALRDPTMDNSYSGKVVVYGLKSK